METCARWGTGATERFAEEESDGEEFGDSGDEKGESRKLESANSISSADMSRKIHTAMATGV
jgi:hypothetical protein